MKIKTILIYLVLGSCFLTQAAEEVSEDFLDFLIEVEESTGDGFTTWLEDDSEDDGND